MLNDRVFFHQHRVTGDRQDGLLSAVVLSANVGKDRIRLRAVGDEIGIKRGDAHVRFEQ